MDIPPFVDAFPIGKDGFPASYLSLPQSSGRTEKYGWRSLYKSVLDYDPSHQPTFWHRRYHLFPWELVATYFWSNFIATSHEFFTPNGSPRGREMGTLISEKSTSIFQRVLFKPKEGYMGTPYHRFSTLWKIQVGM